MASFITNKDKDNTLKERLHCLIQDSDELRFLVGFFYFNGWQEIYERLKADAHLQLKILVGLEVGKHNGKLIEYGDPDSGKDTGEEAFHRTLKSFTTALNDKDRDTQEVYEQVKFFVQMIKEGRLQIRKTREPNHAKLYLFHYTEAESKHRRKKGAVITGSSNLTKSGLSLQEEFNVEILDYGYEEAEAYFNELWDKARKITEDDEHRNILIKVVEEQTQVAEISPFEAYCFVLKTYLDFNQTANDSEDIRSMLERIGFNSFSYQIDAVGQALQKLKEHNGCIIADVVGLGKSVIASLVARETGKKGIVICPPGLMGDKDKKDSGWWGYLEQFGLYQWQVFSRGAMDKIVEAIKGRNFEVVIIDEAHYFRNQDTESYGYLEAICKNKQVVLLTATPFNNSPEDIEALLKLFTIPKQSSFIADGDLDGLFTDYRATYYQLSYIIKNHNEKDTQKASRARGFYDALIEGGKEDEVINLEKVHQATAELSKKIRDTINPVVIRRNRLDLQKDHIYSKEVTTLSKVQDPKELYYELDQAQNAFYDEVIEKYFPRRKSRFTGAIYQPFIYKEDVDFDEDSDGVDDEDKGLNYQQNKEFQMQRNLFDFMRRLLVRRFESSFGAFKESIDELLRVHRLVERFIKKTGMYLLNRKLIEKIENSDIEDIVAVIEKYIAEAEHTGKNPKSAILYKIDEFKYKERFLSDIQSDIKLFEEIRERIGELQLVANDPKREAIIARIQQQLRKEPNRKVILFSEYVATIKHLEEGFRKAFGKSLLVCDGKMNDALARELNTDFNAQYKGTPTNKYKVLLTSDKLSEGFNLNRAGLVINYDIPWNPTRVIQRVGRINRIGTKVFDELMIWNFFPSEKGKSVVRIEEVAKQKMRMIHSALGEDTKILSNEEEPTPSNLGDRIRDEIEGNKEGVNPLTVVRNLYKELSEQYPEVIRRISELPMRVKTAKAADSYGLNVLQRKGRNLFTYSIDRGEGRKVEAIDFNELLERIKCAIDTPKLALSSTFWALYGEVQRYKPKLKENRLKMTTEASVEKRAMNNLQYALRPGTLSEEEYRTHRDFINTLIEDIKRYKAIGVANLRCVAMKNFSPENKKDFVKGLVFLKKMFGADYLKKLIERGQVESEVVIAIENNDQKELF